MGFGAVGCGKKYIILQLASEKRKCTSASGELILCKNPKEISHLAILQRDY